MALFWVEYDFNKFYLVIVKWMWTFYPRQFVYLYFYMFYLFRGCHNVQFPNNPLESFTIFQVLYNNRAFCVCVSEESRDTTLLLLQGMPYPFPEKTHLLSGEHEPTHQNDGSKWVLGIDPDVSGAVALLKTHGSVCSAQVPCFFLSLLAKVLSFSVLCYITWFGCGFIVLDIVGNCGQSGCNCGRGDPKSLILQLKLRLKTVFLKRWH